MSSEATNAEPSKRRGLGCDALVAHYPGRPIPVLREVSLRFPEGAVTSIIGANGSGKTTLLKALSGQLPITSGSAFLDDLELRRTSPRELARVLAILFQDNAAPGDLDVQRLVSYGRFPRRGLLEPPSAEDEAAVERALALCGIGALRKKRLDQSSGGQRQLAWLAMALAQETRWLLLDEPTTYLDVRHQLQVMRVVRTLCDAEGISIVTVMHDVNLAARYSDRMVLLKDGTVIGEGTPEEVVTVERMREGYGIESHVFIDEHTRRPLFVPDAPIEEGASISPE